MKDNQFNRDSYFLNARRDPKATGRDVQIEGQDYAPMDEYTLMNPEEGAEALHLKKTLQAQIEELLYLHPEFDDEHVHVIESDGVITLMGRVTTILDKNLAESLVLELKEVKSVINLLEVDAEGAWMKGPNAENFTKGLY